MFRLRACPTCLRYFFDLNMVGPYHGFESKSDLVKVRVIQATAYRDATVSSFQERRV